MIRQRHYIRGRRNEGTAVSEPSTIPPTGFGSTYNQYLWQRQNTADAKIGVIAAANLAFVALFVPNVPPEVKSPLLTTLLLAIYFLAIILFSLSIMVSFIAFRPQVKAPQAQEKSVLLWRSYLDAPFRDYCHAVRELKDPQAVENAYIKENFRVCQNFACKNKLLRWSIGLFACGSFVALISLILKYFVH